MRNYDEIFHCAILYDHIVSTIADTCPDEFCANDIRFYLIFEFLRKLRKLILYRWAGESFDFKGHIHCEGKNIITCTGEPLYIRYCGPDKYDEHNVTLTDIAEWIRDGHVLCENDKSFYCIADEDWVNDYYSEIEPNNLELDFYKSPNWNMVTDFCQFLLGEERETESDEEHSKRILYLSDMLNVSREEMERVYAVFDFENKFSSSYYNFETEFDAFLFQTDLESKLKKIFIDKPFSEAKFLLKKGNLFLQPLTKSKESYQRQIGDNTYYYCEFGWFNCFINYPEKYTTSLSFILWQIYLDELYTFAIERGLIEKEVA